MNTKSKMGLSQSSFCKLNELKSTSDHEVTDDLIIVKENTSLELEVSECDKEDKMSCILDEKNETRDDNNNSINDFNSRCKKGKRFVPNIIAKKYLNSKKDSDTELSMHSMQCQRRSLKTEDVSPTKKHAEFTHETKAYNNNYNNNDLSYRGVSNDTLEVEEPKKKKSEWETFNFFVRNTYLDSTKITNEFKLEEIDDLNKNDQKEQLDVFQFTWNITCDENNNNLDELVDRENSEQVTEYFQKFLIRNYILAGKSIPEIVELDVDNTRTLDFNFYVCPICEEKLESSLEFSNHLIFCSNKPFFVCLYCTHRTQSVNALRKHILTRHRSQKKLTKCPECHKEMANRNALKRHLAYCGKERKFRCNVCSYRTNIKHNLNKHLSRKRFCGAQECPQSNKEFKRSTCSNEDLKYFEKKSILQFNECIKNTSVDHNMKDCLHVHNKGGKFTKYCPQCFHILGNSKKMNCCLCESRVLYQCKKCDKSFDKYSKIFSHASKCNTRVFDLVGVDV